jgi:hypothetical protein
MLRKKPCLIAAITLYTHAFLLTLDLLRCTLNLHELKVREDMIYVLSASARSKNSRYTRLMRFLYSKHYIRRTVMSLMSKFARTNYVVKALYIVRVAIIICNSALS